MDFISEIKLFLDEQREEKGVYSNYISSLMVKLVLLYGLKNDAIRKLKIKDYNNQ